MACTLQTQYGVALPYPSVVRLSPTLSCSRQPGTWPLSLLDLLGRALLGVPTSTVQHCVRCCFVYIVTHPAVRPWMHVHTYTSYTRAKCRARRALISSSWFPSFSCDFLQPSPDAAVPQKYIIHTTWPCTWPCTSDSAFFSSSTRVHFPSSPCIHFCCCCCCCCSPSTPALQSTEHRRRRP